MKYHPMDDVTRPKRARRMSGKEPLSSSEDSDATMAVEDDDEPSDSDQEEELPAEIERLPDPKAVRHSARSEARKTVNYSKRHHPQDYGLPGYQHLARKRKRKQPKATKTESSPDVETPVQDGNTPTIEISSNRVSSIDASEGEEIVAPPASPPRPRKMLKSLSRVRHSSSPKRAQKKSSSPDKPSSRVDDIISGRRLLNDIGNTVASSTSTIQAVLDVAHAFLAADQKVPSATPFVVHKPYLREQPQSTSSSDSFHTAKQFEGYSDKTSTDKHAPPIRPTSIHASVAPSSAAKQPAPPTKTTRKDIPTPPPRFHSAQRFRPPRPILTHADAKLHAETQLESPAEELRQPTQS